MSESNERGQTTDLNDTEIRKELKLAYPEAVTNLESLAETIASAFDRETPLEIAAALAASSYELAHKVAEEGLLPKNGKRFTDAVEQLDDGYAWKLSIGLLLYVTERLGADADSTLKEQCEKIVRSKPPGLEDKSAQQAIGHVGRLYRFMHKKDNAKTIVLGVKQWAESREEIRENDNTDVIIAAIEKRFAEIGAPVSVIRPRIEATEPLGSGGTYREDKAKEADLYMVVRATRMLVDRIASGELSLSEVLAVVQDATLEQDDEPPITEAPFELIPAPIRRILRDDRSGEGTGSAKAASERSDAAQEKESNHERLQWLLELADKWQESKGSADDPEPRVQYYKSEFSGSGAYYVVTLKERMEDGCVVEHAFAVSTRAGDRDAPYVVHGDCIPEGKTWQDVLAGTKTEARNNGVLRLSNRKAKTTPVDRAFEALSNVKVFEKKREEAERRRLGAVALAS